MTDNPPSLYQVKHLLLRVQYNQETSVNAIIADGEGHLGPELTR